MNTLFVINLIIHFKPNISVKVWSPIFRNEMQHEVTKLISEIKNVSYENQFKNRRLRGDMIQMIYHRICNYVHNLELI